MRAKEYLYQRFADQQREAIEDDFFVRLGEPHSMFAAFNQLDEGYQQMLMRVVDDFLLCETLYSYRSNVKRGIEWVLAEKKLHWSEQELAFLRALEAAPFWLYEVDAVSAGRGLELADVLNVAETTVFVDEVVGSRQARVGDLIGVRLLPDGEKLRIGGAVCLFSHRQVIPLLQEIERYRAEEDHLPPKVVAEMIREYWIDSIIGRPELPTIVTKSGAPMLLIEDDYAVKNLAAFKTTLRAQPDVEGNVDQGWVRVVRTANGKTEQIISAIRIGDAPGTITLFHMSMALAERGREWFRSYFGTLVRHIERREIDPMAQMQPARGRSRSGSTQESADHDIAAEDMHALMQQTVHSMYADWADAPLPLFNNVSPRAMLSTRTGRNRVRALLRSYEGGERAQAKDQGRLAVSYQFLWDDLGLSRKEDK